MQLTNWLKSWWSPRKPARRTRHGKPDRGRVARSKVAAELLEPRTLPAIITVTSLADTVADDGQVTLREAIQAANTDTTVDGATGSGADTIQFASSLTVGGAATITLSGAQLLITSDMTITGPGEDKLTIDGDGRSRIFTVDDGTSAKANVLISGLTMTKGQGIGDGEIAGAILNHEALTISSSTIHDCHSVSHGSAIHSDQGPLTILQSTIRDNSGGTGVISVADGALTVRQSTISGNSTNTYGGGIMLWWATTAIIDQCTIVGNSAQWNGGGIFNGGGPLTVLQSTIVGNFGAAGGGGIYTDYGSQVTLHNSIVMQNTKDGGQAGDLVVVRGPFASAKNNLIGDPGTAGGLAHGVNGNLVGADNGSGGRRRFDAAAVLNTTLSNNGGPMKTLALVSDSPAINAGNNSLIPVDVLDRDGDGNSTEAAPFDQRGNGFARVLNGTVDIGAFEFGAASPPQPIVTVAVSPASVVEDGSSNIIFTLTRDVTSGSLTVNVALSGTATSGNDYSADAANSVTFADGVSTATITVDPSLDTTVESDETVILTVNSGMNYQVGAVGVATGSILNDDCSLSIGVTSLSQVQKSEGNSGTTAFTVVVTRIGSTSSSASANYSVRGAGTPVDAADFGGTFPSGTVSFAPGETSKTITINVTGDSTIEPDENFDVYLSNPIGAAIGPSVGQTGTIFDDDSASFSIAAASASKAEGNNGITPFTFTITRTGGTSGSASANFTVTGTGDRAADADDFGGALPSGAVNFAAGETYQTITINVSGDTVAESREGFTVTLSNPSTGATIGTATASGTIQNDEPGIVADWRFENGAPDTAATTSGSIHDGSGNGHDGTPAGAPLYRSVTSGGLGLEFDAINDRIFVPDHPAFELTESLTLEAILRFDGTTGNTIIYNQIIFRGDDRGALDPYFLAVTLDGRLIFHVENQSGNVSEVVSPAQIPIGEFVHVAGSLDDLTGEQKLFVNGVVVASKVTTIRPFASLDASQIAGLGIGSVQSATYPELFHGVIDAVRISNAALASADFMGGGLPFLPGLTTDELANVLLDESGNLRIRDLAAGGRADRLTLSFDADSQEIVIRDLQNLLRTSIGTIVDMHEIRVARADITGNRLRVELNGGTDQLDLSELPAGLLSVEIDGGDGNDTLIGHAGGDWILGGRGHDSISAGSGNDTLSGGDGNDTLRGEAGHDVIRGEKHNDQLFGGEGNDTCDGGAGDDNVSGETGNDSLMGTTGNDVISGGDGRDRIFGGDGRDSLGGNSGNDQLNGGPGNDSIDGGAGDDFLEGQLGNDLLNGSGGNDTLLGGQDDDQLIGLSGHDRLEGGDGHDVVKGGEGNDTLLGGNGHDNLSGSTGDDFEDGGAGSDTVAGGDGNDSLMGGEDNDTIRGDAGDDSLDGGAGQDVISDTVGTNILPDEEDILL